MRKYLLASLLFAVTGFVGYGQQLNKIQTETQKSDPTFFDMQKAFYDQYDPAHASEPEDEDGNRDGDYEKFKRWEWYWQPRVGRTGKFPAPDVLLTEWNKYVQAHSSSGTRTSAAGGGHHSHLPLSSSGAWTSLGPTTSPSNYQDIGRVNCIAFDSISATTFWVGSPDGGLWKTTDGGTTWSTNTDNLPVIGVSDIAIDNQHRDTMYLATGDGDGANTGSGGDSKSVGVLKTTDGGTTWNTTGLSWTLANVRFIKRLILDPTNPSVLIAATSSGIYRTTNGGTSWTNTQAGYFMDMQMNPGDHNTLCATTYSNGGTAKIYRSTNNGVTWTTVYTGAGIPRIKLAVTPASVNKVDALCIDASSWGFHSIMHSTDGGATWTTALTINAGCTNDYMDDANNASGCYGQGYYDVGFACSPTNPNELYLGGVNTWKSTDNGATWAIKNYWSGGGGVPTVHADKHWFTYQPSTGVFFEGNDGGIYKTTDGGTTWSHLSNGLVISELYRIGTSATSAGDVICGLQDNGSKEDVAGTWSNRTGGDGMEALIDYTNVNIQYSTYVQGLIYRTTNHWGSSITLVNNNSTGVNSAGLWVTPYVENPLNHNGLYVGKDRLYRGFNAGSAATAGAVTWANISASLTFPAGSSQLINAIAVAPSDTNTIYIACDQYLYRTTNGGTAWTLVNTAAENITYIAISNTNVNNVWFTLSGYTAGSKVFATTTGGASWTNVSGTLPNIPVNTIVYSNTGANGEYIGTDLGVYYLGTAAADWVPFNTNLPNVVVDELEICYTNSKIYAATFGRGLWSSDLYTNITPITGTFTVCANSTTPLTDATSGGTWSSTNTAVGTVGTSGIVTGITAGTTTISYTVGATGSVTAIVTVIALPAAITPANPTVCAGSTINLTDATAGGTWSSVNTAVGTISSAGVVTGISAGTTAISYTASTGCAVKVVVTVNALPVATITPAGATTFCAPGSVTLNANSGTYTYQWQVGGGNIPGATTASYSASNTGNYTVIETLAGCSGTSAPVAVTVNSVGVTPITGGSQVCIGQTLGLSDATTGGVWSSSAAGTASVSTAGVVTGVSGGTASISYSFTNACGTAVATNIVTVSAGVAVAPITGTLNVCVGNNTTLSDVTPSGAWNSSNSSVAGVVGGVVTGAAVGTANISYNVTSGSGCVSRSVVTVTVNAMPVLTISPAGPVVICPGGSTLFTAASGAGYTYQWQNGLVNIPGETNSTYTATGAGNFGVVVTTASGCSGTSASVTVTIGAGTTVTPSVTITPSLGTILCATTSTETFTANPVNGGSSPAYQWSVNGTIVGTGATYSYSPANGDLITCLLTSNAACVMPDTVSASVVMTISPLITPSVSITSIHNDSTCTGDTVQFAAVPVYGGTAPTYLWTENGINVATGPYYIYTPQDGDTLIVTMTSNYPCLLTPIAVSNIFIMHVFAPMVNGLSVSVTQSSIIAGAVDTFTATASGAGASPTFQWYINGNPIAGATGNRYITDSLRAGQIVSCLETSSFVCSEPRQVMSGGISVSVLPNGLPQLGNGKNDFVVVPNPNHGSFTITGSVRFAADDKVTISVVNMLGQVVCEKTSKSINGHVNESVVLSDSTPAGMYLVSVTSGGDHFVFHVAVDK